MKAVLLTFAWLLVLAGGAAVFAGIYIVLTSNRSLADMLDGGLSACVGAVMAVGGAVIIPAGRRRRDEERSEDEG